MLKKKQAVRALKDTLKVATKTLYEFSFHVSFEEKTGTNKQVSLRYFIKHGVTGELLMQKKKNKEDEIDYWEKKLKVTKKLSHNSKSKNLKIAIYVSFCNEIVLFSQN